MSHYVEIIIINKKNMIEIKICLFWQTFRVAMFLWKCLNTVWPKFPFLQSDMLWLYGDLCRLTCHDLNIDYMYHNMLLYHIA